MAVRGFQCALMRFMLAGLLTSGGCLTAWAQGADELTALDKQVIQLQDQGKYTEAIGIGERALALAQRLYGPEHLDVGRSLNNLAALYDAVGRYPEAEPLYLRALAIAEKALGPDHPNVGSVLNNLAMLYRAQGRHSEAEPLLRRGLLIAEKALGSEHSDLGVRLDTLAALYYAEGRYTDAEPLMRRALAIKEKALGPDHPDVGAALNNLAEVCRNQGRYREAEPLFQRALAITEKALGSDHEHVGVRLNSLAKLYYAEGRYREAEPLLRRALTITEKAAKADHADVDTRLSNLALVYEAQGRYSEAEPLLQRALAITEKALGPDHPDVGTRITGLAMVQYAQGRYTEAEPLFRRALAITEKALGSDHPQVGTRLNNLALLCEAQGRYPEADRLYQRDLAITEKALGPDHPNLGRSLNNLAVLHYVQRDWLRAADYWRRSAAVIVRRTQRGTENVGQALTGKGKTEAEQSSWRFLGLVKTVHRLATESGPGRIPGSGVGQSLLREAFQTAQRAQASEAAKSLTQMAARQAKGDGALARLVRERQDLVTEWQERDQRRIAAVAQRPEHRDRRVEAANVTRLAAIDTRVAEIDNRLMADFPDYAALANPAPLSIEEVQAQLGADEALVLLLDTPEWQPLPEETFIWVITKTDSRWVRSALGTPSLKREVAALRCGLDWTLWRGGEEQNQCVELVRANPAQESINGQIVDVLPFDLERAHALYQALLAPVEDMIKGRHLLMVPSGPLTSLPIHLLVGGPPKAKIPRTLAEYREVEWLATRQPITVLPSVASLKSLRQFAKASRAGKAYLGIGNPLLDGPQDHPQWGEHFKKQADAARAKQQCPRTKTQRIAFAVARPPASFSKLFRGGQADIEEVRRWTPLPETADELCEVGRRLGVPESEILLGSRATEVVLKDMSQNGRLANYAILHFATHGGLAGQAQGLAEPGLVLTPPAKGTIEPQALERDDGFLTVSEIATLKLDADWVVLSACNTAGASGETAEPLSGMARAFFYAGARALLVSHWEVGSDAAVKLTTRAFAELKSNPRLGRAEALRVSMRELFENGTAFEAHPSQWAPFVVVGEGAAAR